MKFQTDYSHCGAAAMANALRCLGFAFGDDAVGAVAGTDGDGTTPTKMKRAARELGAKVEVISERKYFSARAQLICALDRGDPAVLIVDKGEHWVTAFGLLGLQVLVFDPAGSVRDHNSLLDIEELERAWKVDGRYYAIVVSEED